VTREFPSAWRPVKRAHRFYHGETSALKQALPILTDDEGTFLALLVRVQPATAYQLSKIYAESPVSNFGTSKGKIYPLIRRLKERGLIVSRRVTGDARGSEMLQSTRGGREAVRAWVKHIRATHLLLEDPLRTMVQSFDLLSREEQIEWIENAKAGLRSKLAELEAYAAGVTVPYKEQVHDNAVSSVRCRLEWLDRLSAELERHRPSNQLEISRVSR
jgi:DNA-binding PadR family transcriptional regulator